LKLQVRCRIARRSGQKETSRVHKQAIGRADASFRTPVKIEIRTLAQGPRRAGIRGIVGFAEWETEETSEETGFLEP
jgi:hypothetical protein